MQQAFWPSCRARIGGQEVGIGRNFFTLFKVSHHMRDQRDLSKQLNQSGFPLQLAIDNLVRGKAGEIGWSVLYREHGWSSPDGQSGFADLVLENQYRTAVMVLECKRVLDSDWLFIEEQGSNNETLRTRVWVNNTPETKAYSGYFDIRTKPVSPESMYCVIGGQDTRSRPLLERVSAETCAAMEAIALEEYPHMKARNYGFRMYAPVIVTTARLSVSSVDASSLSLSTGEAGNVTHREVPFVRFRKQLSSAFAIQPNGSASDFSQLAAAREKMVFVVNAEHIARFLKLWDPLNDSFRPLM